MVRTLNLDWTDVQVSASRIARQIVHDLTSRYQINFKSVFGVFGVYGIPNGGIFAAQVVVRELNAISESEKSSWRFVMVEKPSEADVMVDDIIDSGKTRDHYTELYECTVYALHDKPNDPSLDGIWVSFPWERMKRESSVEDNIVRIIQYIGDDPKREGLKETPARVARSYKELFSGYGVDPKDIMKVFEEGACDEMVVLRDIEFSSTCEHHMLPFLGTATVAYIPDGKVIGVSKLARLVDIYARRLQIQEKMTQQITSALMDHLVPKGAGCIIEAQHLCMACRGVRKTNSKMITSSLTGVFREPQVRAEFLKLAR